MTVLVFPSNPQIGDSYSAPNGRLYIYDGVKWVVNNSEITSDYVVNFVQDSVASVFTNVSGNGITFTYNTATNYLTANADTIQNLGLKSRVAANTNTVSVFISNGEDAPANWAFTNDFKLLLPTGGAIEPVGMGWTGLTNRDSGTPVSLVNKSANANPSYLGSQISAVHLYNNEDTQGRVFIESGDVVSGKYNQWMFEYDGTLNLPDAGDSTSVIQTPNNLELRANNKVLRLDTSGNLNVPGNIVSSTSTSIIANNYVWEFSRTGALTLADGSRIADGVWQATSSTLSLQMQSTTYDVRVTTNNNGTASIASSDRNTNYYSGVLANAEGFAIIHTYAASDNYWTFDGAGKLTLPGGGSVYSDPAEVSSIYLQAGSEGDNTWLIGSADHNGAFITTTQNGPRKYAGFSAGDESILFWDGSKQYTAFNRSYNELIDMPYRSVFDYMTAEEIADVTAGTLAYDLTTKIQNAINANTRLYFPPGAYSVSGTLTVNNPNTTIVADKATIKRRGVVVNSQIVVTTLDSEIISVQNTSGIAVGQDVSGVFLPANTVVKSINGNLITLTKKAINQGAVELTFRSTPIGFRITAINVTVKGLGFDYNSICGSYTTPLIRVDAPNATFDNCILATAPEENGHEEMVFYTTSGANNCTIKNSTVTGIVNATNIDNFVFDNNKVLGSIGVSSLSSPSSHASDARITNNYIELLPKASNTSANTSDLNPYAISTGARDGSQPPRNIIISNNTIVAKSECLFFITIDTTVNATISNNTFHTINDFSMYCGIEIVRSDNIISSGNILDFTSLASYPTTGYSVNSSRNCAVTDNTISFAPDVPRLNSNVSAGISAISPREGDKVDNNLFANNIINIPTIGCGITLGTNNTNATASRNIIRDNQIKIYTAPWTTDGANNTVAYPTIADQSSSAYSQGIALNAIGTGATLDSNVISGNMIQSVRYAIRLYNTLNTDVTDNRTINVATNVEDVNASNTTLVVRHNSWQGDDALTITNTTDSTSTTTGALKIAGGVGVGGSLYASKLYDSGNRVITTVSAGTDTAVKVTNDSLLVWNTSTLQSITNRSATTDQAISITNSTAATSPTTGALKVTGGVGANNAYFNTLSVDGQVSFGGLVTFTGTATYVYSTNTVYTDSILELHTPPGGVDSSWSFDDQKDVGFRFRYYNGENLNGALILANDTKYLEWYKSGAESTGSSVIVNGTYGTFKTGSIVLVDPTAASNTSTGALIVAGGVGVGGSLYATQLYDTGNRVITTVSAGTDTTVKVTNDSLVIWNNSTLQTITNRGLTTTNVINITNATVASSTTTGALKVTGGIGAQNAYLSTLNVNGNVAASSTTTGVLVVTGGIGAQNAYLSRLNVNGNVAASSTTTGVLVVTGGIGAQNAYLSTLNVTGNASVSGNLYAGQLYDSGNRVITAVTAGTDTSAVLTNDTLIIWNNSTLQTITGRGATTDQAISITNITTASSTSTGALKVAGGVGIGGSLYAAALYAPTIFDNGNRVITTVSAGTDTAVKVTNDSLLIWNNSTLQTVTDRGLTTTNVINITNTTAASNTSTGALKIAGGVGVGGSLYATQLYDTGNRVITTVTAGTDTSVKVTNDSLVVWNTSTLQSITGRGATTDQVISITNITTSSSTSTGALKVAGGVGVGGSLYATALYAPTIFDNGNRVITTVTAGTDTAVKVTNDSLVVWNTSTLQTITGRGAITDQAITITNATTATNNITGALIIRGGVGVTGNLYSNAVYDNSVRVVSLATAGTDTSISISNGNISVWNTSTLQTITGRGATTTNAISITNATVASSTTTGALKVTGGIGAGNIYAGKLDVINTATFNGPLSFNSSVGDANTFLLSRGSGQSPAWTTNLTYNGAFILAETAADFWGNNTNYVGLQFGSSVLYGARYPGGLGLASNGGYDGNDWLYFNDGYLTLYNTDPIYDGSHNWYTSPYGSGGNYLNDNGGWNKLMDLQPNATLNVYGQINVPTIVVGEGFGNLTAGSVYANEIYDSNARVITTATLATWNTSTLQTVTSLGNSTNQAISVTNTTAATNNTTGALKVTGGVGVGGNLYAAQLYDNSNRVITTVVAGTDTSAQVSGSSLTVWNKSTLQTVTDRGSTTNQLVRITNGTTASSTTTGALVVTGGIGAANAYLDTLNVTGSISVGGTVTFSGGATYVASTNTVYTDNLIDLHSPPGGVTAVWTTDDLKDIGFRLRHFYNSTDTTAALVLANDTRYLEWYVSGVDISNPNVASNGNYGTFKTGSIVLTDGTQANSTITGALKVAGGVGVGGNLYASKLYDNNNRVITTVSAGTDTAVQVTDNSLLVWNTSTLQSITGRGATTDQVISITNITTASSTSTGALKVAGGVGIGGSLYASAVYDNSVRVVTLATAGADTTVSITNGNISVANTSTLQTVTGRGATTDQAISITNTTAATNNTTGALKVTGGVGVGGNLYANAIYDNNSRVITTGTIASNAVTTLTAGTDTAVSASAGAVTVWNASTLQTVTGRGATTDQVISITNITTASSTSTGALKVAGGVGIGGSLYASAVYDNSVRVVTAATAGTDTTVSITNGNISVANTSTLQTVTGRGATTDQAISITNATASTNNTTGALKVTGGVGVGGNLYASQLYDNNNRVITTVSAGTDTSVQVSGSSLSVWNTSTLQTVTGRGATTNQAISITNITSATSTSTGAFIVAGGVGVGGNLYATAVYDNGVRTLTSSTLASAAPANSVIYKSSGVLTGTSTFTISNDNVIKLGSSTNYWDSAASGYSQGGTGIINGLQNIFSSPGLYDLTSSIFAYNAAYKLTSDDPESGLTYNWYRQTTNPVMIYQQSYGGHSWSTVPAGGTAGGIISPQPRMRIGSNGYVGIGNVSETTEPSYTLDVNGTLRVTSAASFASATFSSGQGIQVAALYSGAATYATRASTIFGTPASGSEFSLDNVGSLSTRNNLSYGDSDTLNHAFSVQFDNDYGSSAGSYKIHLKYGTGLNGSGTWHNWIAYDPVNTNATSFYTNDVLRMTISSTGVVSITNTTTATSTTTGALTVTGGVGIGGSLYAYGLINGLHIGSVFTNTNTRLGYRASESTTGSNLIAIGHKSLMNNMGGSGHVSIGYLAMSEGSNGTKNVAVGSDALTGTYGNNGSFNVAVGSNAATLGISGAYNTVLGPYAGPWDAANHNTLLGGKNVYVGAYAGSGSYNNTQSVFVGYQAGSSITGDYNVVLGNWAGGGTIGSAVSNYVVLADGEGNVRLYANSTGAISITSTDAATSISSGALKVAGGVGVTGSLYASAVYDNGTRVLTNAVTTLTAGTDTSISTATGAVTVWNQSTLQSVTSRGATTDQAINITNTTIAFNTLSGALKVAGGVGVSGNLYASQLYDTGNRVITTVSAGTDTAVKVTNDSLLVWNTSTLQTVTDRGATTTNIITITNTTSATSTSTGALKVAGGVGVGGSLYAAALYAPTIFDNGNRVITTVSAGTDTAVKVTNDSLTVWNNSTLQTVTGRGATTNQAITVTNTTDADDTATGAIIVTGGVGIGKNLYVGGVFGVTGNVGFNGTLNVSNNTVATNNAAAIYTSGGVRAGNIYNAGDIYNGGGLQVVGVSTLTGAVSITNTTAATSTTTGALKVAGGVGIQGSLYAGSLTISNASTLTGAVSIAGVTKITNSTNSDNATNGALVVSGGVGVSGDAYFGGAVNADSIVSTNAASISGMSVGLGGNNISGNIAIGEGSPLGSNYTGGSNTALGYAALQSNYGGSYNVAVGEGAIGGSLNAGGTVPLPQNTASYNVAVGVYSLSSLDGGVENIAIGFNSQAYNYRSNKNTSIGHASMSSVGYSHTSDEQNTAVGHAALAYLGSDGGGGSNNVAVGSSALAHVGSTVANNNNNVAVGTEALVNISGVGNTAIGYGAGSNLSSGNYNVFIGGFSGAPYSNYTSCVAISDGNGSVRIYSDGQGNTGIGTGVPISPFTKTLHVGGTGISTTQASVTSNTTATSTTSAALIVAGGIGAQNAYLSSLNVGTVVPTGVIVPRTSSTTSVSTLSWNSSLNDLYILSSQAVPLTINADSASTPYEGQKVVFRIKASVTGSALTLTTGVPKGFRILSGVVVPTTLTANYTLYIGCQYNAVDSRWDVLGTKQGN